MQGLFPGQRTEGPIEVAPGSRLVRVVVERGIDTAAGEGLTYLVEPDVEAEGQIRVGERVRVPLGRRNAPAAGIVVAVGGVELLAGARPRSALKAVLSRTGAGLPERLVELGRWIAEYYICPLGMVLAAMVPAAVKKGTGRRTVVEVARAPAEKVAAVDVAKLKPSARAAWEACSALPDLEWPVGAKALGAKLGLKSIGPINRLIEAGLLMRVERTEVRAASPAWEGLTVEAVAEAGVRDLTAAQRQIVDGIGADLGGFGVHLVRGVTGSGKTEVYIRLIERVLERGQQAIVLVPEIALTPQTAGRFLARFRGGVAVLHSGLSAAQRNKEWARAAAGGVKVVVGARSAVFAPLERLGLIVVDEEHDSSGYKQDQLPRYHGRDVAIKRGQIEGCPVVLGSATPSLESWSNAVGSRYRLWELTERVGGGRLPKVEIVDLAAERRARAARGDFGRHLLGPRLQTALGQTLEDGGQAILLLNRRGYSNLVSCANRGCGWVMGCEYCDATMVLHRGKDLPAGTLVRCHHCLAEQRTPTQCPVCAGRVTRIGTGTQRLEDEIAAKFADLSLGAMPGVGQAKGLVEGVTMLRVDSDTMASARDYFEALSGFAAGRVRLLLGTQLISKGLDYPNVRLVGVVDADTALHLPDFRASERTFQLVSQVAGRTGRGAAAGRVIVQTNGPNNPAIVAAAAHDYVGFATAELALRREAELPPVTRMARIVVRDRDYSKAAAEAKVLAEHLRAVGEGMKIEGPISPAVERIAGFYRVAVEATAPTARRLVDALSALRAAGLLKSDARTAVDVDPASLM
jgi:primosomal protein N' (replication factor Y) (superfamily II helicase)